MFIHSDKPYIPRKPKKIKQAGARIQDIADMPYIGTPQYAIRIDADILNSKEAKKLADWLVRAAMYIQYKEKE